VTLGAADAQGRRSQNVAPERARADERSKP
jgi:hypothetical protein